MEYRVPRQLLDPPHSGAREHGSDGSSGGFPGPAAAATAVSEEEQLDRPNTLDTLNQAQ